MNTYGSSTQVHGCLCICSTISGLACCNHSTSASSSQSVADCVPKIHDCLQCSSVSGISAAVPEILGRKAETPENLREVAGMLLN